jgi:hypothetical protein
LWGSVLREDGDPSGRRCELKWPTDPTSYLNKYMTNALRQYHRIKIAFLFEDVEICVRNDIDCPPSSSASVEELIKASAFAVLKRSGVPDDRLEEAYAKFLKTETNISAALPPNFIKQVDGDSDRG